MEQKAVAESREGFPEAGAAARPGVVEVLQMCITEGVRAKGFEGQARLAWTKGDGR